MKGIENRHYEGLDRVLDQGMESDQPLHPQRSSLSQLHQPDLNREKQRLDRTTAIRTSQHRRGSRLTALTSRASRQLSRIR